MPTFEWAAVRCKPPGLAAESCSSIKDVCDVLNGMLCMLFREIFEHGVSTLPYVVACMQACRPAGPLPVLAADRCS
jgi:hypothetical protein